MTVHSIVVVAPRKTSRYFLRLTAGFALLHWLLLLVTSAVIMGRGVHRLDHPEFPTSGLERICKMAKPILEQPYEGFMHATHLPRGWVSLALGLLTSLLWGATFALVVLLIEQRKRHVTQP